MQTRDLDISTDSSTTKSVGTEVEIIKHAIQLKALQLQKELRNIKRPLWAFMSKVYTDEQCLTLIKRHPKRYAHILDLAAELYGFNKNKASLFPKGIPISYVKSMSISIVGAALSDPLAEEHSRGIRVLLTQKLQALKEKTLAFLFENAPEEIPSNHLSFTLLEKNFEKLYLRLENKTFNAKCAKKIWPDLKLLNTARLDKIIKGELSCWEQIVVGELGKKYPHKINDIKQIIFNILTLEKKIQENIDQKNNLIEPRISIQAK